MDLPDNIAINHRTYQLCVRAFRTARKLLKLNIKLHADDDSYDAARQGDIFLFNHFARFETFIPQYLLHEEVGAYCRSVASSEFFKGDQRFSDFLYSVGVIPNDMPNLFSFLAREILHGRKLVMFPEGGMVKDKRVIDQDGIYSIFSRSANERRKHHRGAAVIALALDAFKTAILSDYSKGNYQRVDRWAEQLDFENTETLVARAIKPTVIVPSHITFYPLRVNDNFLHQSAQLFNNKINKRFAEELIIEGNLLFKDTDMDIRFSKPLIAGKYWRPWEKWMLPNVVHSFDSLEELFSLKAKKNHWGGRLFSTGMTARSNRVRDDYMKSMYQAVTINLSHIASRLVHSLYESGHTRIRCNRFHKILYLAIKQIQKTDLFLHRSLMNPDDYGAIVNQGSSRLAQFLKTANRLKLVSIENGQYVINDKLKHEFDIDEIRTENIIGVYSNEIAPSSEVTKLIEKSISLAQTTSAVTMADHRFDDQLLALRYDRKAFDKPRYKEINDQQTATEDANWFFLRSSDRSASAVLLIHGFLSSPAEVRSLGDHLHSLGHHVLAVRLKGHGTSPWDLRNRNWQDWYRSVSQGFDILKAYSDTIHLVGFSTGGLLALLFAAENPHIKIKSTTSVSAPIEFRNKNLRFVPLLHHANKLVRWVSSEGLMPFRPNQPENPSVNYQHIPIRAVYQLQKLIAHILDNKLNIGVRTFLYQGDQDPVVDPASLQILGDVITCPRLTSDLIASSHHGVIFSNIGNIHQKIGETLNKSLYTAAFASSGMKSAIDDHNY
ncbi:MAG: esterase/lipase/1-acyl-sn-glycerol-3-phosphate acyltransferase [Gammaproteobacteria bacterium]|jgi:esterase/lipase/1-acyl-sn-glycerol-3-phosphate acyltransferase